MTNKEFQEILKRWPDDYDICIDTTFPWNTPKSENKKLPELYVNMDFGTIEIEPLTYLDMDAETVEKVLKIAGIQDVVNSQELANKFNDEYC